MQQAPPFTPPARQSNPDEPPRRGTFRKRLIKWGVYRAYRRAILDCKVRGPVLLAPCGHGWFFGQMRQDGFPFVGLDLEPARAAAARASVSPPATVLRGNILKLPFADGQFELIVNNRFLLHFNEEFRAAAFKELARVTSRYLLVHYDAMSLRHWVRKLRGAREPERGEDTLRGWRRHKRPGRKLLFDREGMEREGSAAGLRISKLYRVCPVLSDRVYCLYEKI